MAKNNKYPAPVTHYFITNRFIDHNGNVNNDGKKPAQDDLRIGTYTFDGPDDPGTPVLMEEPKNLDKIFENPNDTALRKDLPSEILFRTFHEEMLSAHEREHEVLIFVHGFNNSFEDGLKSIRLLHERYVLNEESPIKKIIAYCWPSNGRLNEYRADAEDAADSGRTLGRFYIKLLKWYARMHQIEGFKECGQNMHLMAHSMGNQVLESMIGTLAKKGYKPRSLFKEVISVGSDVDYDVFDENKALYDLIDYCERVHVYFHRKDRALSISESTKNALNRLGKWGFKNSNRVPDDVMQCDVTDTEDDLGGLREKPLNHWYYYTSSEVIDDIIAILNGSGSLYYA